MSRSSLQVACSVWHAVFLREALSRTTANRFAWFWMIAEPLALVVLMVLVREMLGRVRFVVGADFIPWLVTGVMPFFLFRDLLLRSIGAVEANKALFTYRQVMPIDPVLARNAVEGLLRSVIFLILIAGGVLLGHDLLPADSLEAIGVWVAVWLLGTGAGLVVSAASSLVPEIGRVVRIMMLPVFMLSGAVLPLQTLPHDVQQVLLYNPLPHAIEGLRQSFYPGYKTLHGLNLLYVWYSALILLALGLALHVRFANRMKAK